jgi:hypothetical protein
MVCVCVHRYAYLTQAEQANNVPFIRAIGNWLNQHGGTTAAGGIACCCGPSIPECYTSDVLYVSSDNNTYTTRVHWIMSVQSCGTNPTTEAVLDSLNGGHWNGTEPYMLGQSEGYAHDDQGAPGTGVHPFICVRQVPYSLADTSSNLPCVPTGGVASSSASPTAQPTLAPSTAAPTQASLGHAPTIAPIAAPTSAPTPTLPTVYSWASGASSGSAANRIEWDVVIPPGFMNSTNARNYCAGLGNGFHLFSRAAGSNATVRP